MSKVGHHRVSLESTKLVLGVATETEAKEILVQAKQFYVEVENWITKNRPALKM